MKKQGIIFLVSLWGLLAFPIGYLNELIEDHKIRSLAWLQYPLGVIMLALVWGWYAPALGVAKALGIFDQVYELEIAVYPKNVIGWLLPVGCWYLIFNIAVLLKRIVKGPNKAIEIVGGPRPRQPRG